VTQRAAVPRAVRAALHAAIVVALCAGAARAQYGPARTMARQAGAATQGKPDFRYERVAGEVVAGTYAGVAGYFLGRGVGTIATMMLSSDDERLRDQIVDAVGWTGAAFAIGGTVYAIGDMGAEAGSFPRTMVGVTAGAAASLAISRLIFHGRVPADKWSARRKWWMATLECSLPAIGGTIAFNASRKWDR